MSENTKNSLEKILPQLKCHFTWNLFKGESVPSDLEDRVCNQIKCLNTEFKATMYNLLAYIKHLDGQNEAALECLQQAEDFIQREHAGQTEIRSLVTWGNYAWVYYHMGRFSEAQIYVDKVKQSCKKFSNPYSLESPELDCEEGWTRLKCGRNERAKMCFEKALEEKPGNPEFASGLAIAMYCLDNNPQKQWSVDAFKEAVDLNPDNQYVKVLLALKLQTMNKEAEGEQLVEEALEKAPCQTDVLRSAAKFYRKKGDLDKAIELFLKALESIPNNAYLCHQIGCCYKAKARQIQNAGESEARANREKIEELQQCALDYLNKARERGLNPLNPDSNLPELLEAEECYQISFSKELPHAERQQLLQGHCHSLERGRESADTTTVQQHLQGLSISKTSTEKGEMKQQAQNTAENPLPQNVPNSWYRQGLIHKQNGDLQQATKCYEKELGRLLRDVPSGIGSLLLSASELEEGSEETSQGAGKSNP
ncbi:interferon-induced protein with tetratricopeptide repeats 3 isoform X2 [Nycticebus coucang]|nr:interferon-induced protein with tetratricopeptide repeats 3 isoform X2 [Nycticebus coucang]